MIRYEVLWSEPAEADLHGIMDFVSSQSAQRAKRLWRVMQRRAESLASFPYRSRLVPELKGIGLDIYRELIISPYRLLFRVKAKRVLVLGLFDGRRDLEDVLFERITRF